MNIHWRLEFFTQSEFSITYMIALTNRVLIWNIYQYSASLSWIILLGIENLLKDVSLFL